MRPGQNKRMRGRNNGNNRKGPNPLTRSYESNGPDVKVRGTAQHVAEKYLQLARDAQSSGDPVMAESYLQHAEHYFRLIATAMQAQQQQQSGYTRPPGENADLDDDDDDDDMPDRFASPFERNQPNLNPPPPSFANQPQPFAERQPPIDRPQHQERGPRPERQENRQENRPERHERPERQERQDRHNQPREFRDNRQQRDRNFHTPRPAPLMTEAVPQDAPQPVPTLPAFITGGVRPVGVEPVPPATMAQPATPQAFEAEQDNAAFHLRNRRRRRPQPTGEGGHQVMSGQENMAENARSERPLPDEVPAGE